MLFVVGYKLAKPANFKKMFDSGMAAFIPFVVTILAIVFIDLLKGLGIGLVVALIAGRVLPAKTKLDTSRLLPAGGIKTWHPG